MIDCRNYLSVLLMALGVMLLSACAERRDSHSDASPNVGTNLTPSGQNGQSLWQPPEPSTYYYEVLPTPTSPAHPPDTIIVYSASGFTQDLMTITKKGIARVNHYGGYGDITFTLQLSPDHLNALLVRFDEARFFELQDVYVKPTPNPEATEDVGEAHTPYFTITYSKDGRSKSVSTKGIGVSSEAFDEIIISLSDLYSETINSGIKQQSRPDPLVFYHLEGSKQRVWTMNIDVEGGISYIYSPPAAYLTPEELMELKEMFEKVGWFGLQDWYSAPHEQRDIMTEHRAIIRYYRDSDSEDVNILTGANIPSDVELILIKLAQIYDKYAPPGSKK